SYPGRNPAATERDTPQERAMKQSLDDRKQSCSWSLGVSLSIAFTDEVRTPHLFRIGRKLII
ncbi:hypothetical protein, partial [Bacteroides uniformis]|uniref:hypothetical protein n=1 Tax=Bacteroides uniformis TaxID=820 RepID=UPI0032BFA6E5